MRRPAAFLPQPAVATARRRGAGRREARTAVTVRAPTGSRARPPRTDTPRSLPARRGAGLLTSLAAGAAARAARRGRGTERSARRAHTHPRALAPRLRWALESAGQGRSAPAAWLPRGPAAALRGECRRSCSSGWAAGALPRLPRRAREPACPLGCRCYRLCCVGPAAAPGAGARPARALPGTAAAGRRGGRGEASPGRPGRCLPTGWRGPERF